MNEPWFGLFKKMCFLVQYYIDVVDQVQTFVFIML